MKKQYATEAQALADRCVNYSDALVALVFIGASGLGIALADPDTRSSMNLITSWMIGANIGLGAIIFTMPEGLMELDHNVVFPIPEYAIWFVGLGATAGYLLWWGLSTIFSKADFRRLAVDAHPVSEIFDEIDAELGDLDGDK